MATILNFHDIYINNHLSVLTAWDIWKFAESKSLIRFSSVAPRPIFIEFTTVIRGLGQCAVWEITRNKGVAIGKLRIPSLTSMASDSHGDVTSVTANIHMITQALV